MRCRRLALLTAIFFLFSICTACTPAAKTFSKTIFAMDTVMTLTANGLNAEEAIETSVARLFELDALLSVTKEDSEIARLNAANGEPVCVSREVYDLIKLAVVYSERFAGCFDLTISPVVSLWGFYTDEFSIPKTSDLNRVLQSVDYQNVIFQDDFTVVLLNEAEIDLGGIAKGYAAEAVRSILTEYQIDSAVLDLGGNVLTLGTRSDGSPWRIAVRNPFDADKQLCVLTVSDKALVTSGSYQRYFEENGIRYHHIMNPETGRPADTDLLSVTVIADDAAYADALSTALFVMGYERAVEYWRESGDFEAIFVLSSRDVFCTSGAMALLAEKDDSFALIS